MSPLRPDRQSQGHAGGLASCCPPSSSPRGAQPYAGRAEASRGSAGSPDFPETVRIAHGGRDGRGNSPQSLAPTARRTLVSRPAEPPCEGIASRLGQPNIDVVHRSPLEQAAAKDRVEFDAVETDRCDVQRAAANLLVSVVDGLLDPQAALAP